MRGWTWPQATDVFVGNPNRILVAQKGELPLSSESISRRMVIGIAVAVAIFYPSER